jgi:hypothetical protein
MTLLAGAAMATALLASGCGTGQIAETAEKVAAVPGASGDVTSNDGSFSVRNALVVYHGDGYKAGDNVPLDLRIFNNSGKTVTVTVTSPDAKSVALAAGAKGTPAPSASPSESPASTPSATATPSGEPTSSATPSATPSAEPTPTAEAPARPASVQIAPGSFAALTSSGQQVIELVGLNEELKPGESVELVFDFAGTKLTLAVPMAVPLTPVPRGSAEVAEEGH